MYKHILVPVDGSDTSNRALKEAIGLAKEQQSTLRLIHVVDVTVAYNMAEIPFPFPEYQDTMRNAGEKLLAECADVVRSSGVAFDTKCQIIDTLGSRVCELIEQEAKSWPADLIVIGTHGRHGFDRLILGSVAEGVIRLTTKPVLCVRAA